MKVITAALADMTSTVLDDSNFAVDGCSIPTYAIALRALALAFARFGSGQGMDADRAAAARRIRAAVAAQPRMVAGTNRFDTSVIAALGERVFVKGGAEGVHCGTIPELGLGFAVTCDDGARRAADVVTAALIARLLPNNGAADAVVASLANPVLRNWNGIEVGMMRAAGPLV